MSEVEGDMNSVLSLAGLYLTGYKTIPIDIPKAIKYYSMAAEAGWASAQGQLGYLLATGMGNLPVEAGRAIELLAAADKRQDSTGTMGLGYCYFKGIGVASSLSLEPLRYL
jgi:TPR repeat protein